MVKVVAVLSFCGASSCFLNLNNFVIIGRTVTCTGFLALTLPIALESKCVFYRNEREQILNINLVHRLFVRECLCGYNIGDISKIRYNFTKDYTWDIVLCWSIMWITLFWLVNDVCNKLWMLFSILFTCLYLFFRELILILRLLI